MRVALVAEDYYPQLGGVPEHVHNLALRLNSWGHTATVISSHMGSYPDAAFVRRVGTSRVIYSTGGVSRITTGRGLRRELAALFRDGRYDIVHVHGGLAPTFGLAAPSAAWAAGIPVVATFHSWFARSLACRVFRRPLQRILDRHAATIAVSQPVVDANSRYFRADWLGLVGGQGARSDGVRHADDRVGQPRVPLGDGRRRRGGDGAEGRSGGLGRHDARPDRGSRAAPGDGGGGAGEGGAVRVAPHRAARARGVRARARHPAERAALRRHGADLRDRDSGLLTHSAV